MVLKGYFDGAQTADADRVTLASVSGTCDEWTPVERAWKQVIADHKAPPLHTTNAYALQKEFKGWTNEKVNDYISACVDVLEGSLAQPGKILVPTASGYLPNIVKTGLNGITMTIPLDDFRRARDKVENFPNAISELCASETLGFVLRYGKRLGVEGYRLHFDRNEPFYGHVRDRWNSKKSRKQIPEIKKVVHVGESDMAASSDATVLFSYTTHPSGTRAGTPTRISSLGPKRHHALDHASLPNVEGMQRIEL